MGLFDFFGKRNSTISESSSSQDVERKALELINATKWRQVIDLCEDWLKRDPNNFMILKALGSAYYHSGKKNEETKLFSSLINKYSNIRFDVSNETSILTVSQLKQLPFDMKAENWVAFQQYGDLVGTPNELTGLFVVVKINSNKFNLRAFKGCQLLLDYIPTEHYPLLWFRAQLDDGSCGKAVVEHFIDISDKQRISQLIKFIKSKTAIISIYDEQGILNHISGLILDHPSQTTRYLAQIYACEKDYIDNFSHASADDYSKAQRSIANIYPVTQEW